MAEKFFGGFTHSVFDPAVDAVADSEGIELNGEIEVLRRDGTQVGFVGDDLADDCTDALMYRKNQLLVSDAVDNAGAEVFVLADVLNNSGQCFVPGVLFFFADIRCQHGHFLIEAPA